MKIKYFLFSAIFPFFVNAQSFTYQSNTGLNLSGCDSVNLCDTVTIINNTGTIFNVICNNNISQMTAGHSKYFCFGPFCYSPSVTVAIDSIQLKPSKSADLKAYVIPSHIIGTDDVTYQFYDNAGLSDTLSVMIHYDFSLTGVVDLKKPNYILDGASPNPARSITAISYQYSSAKDARVVFYNILGSPVKEIKLQNNKGVSLIDASQFASGVYIYSLVIDGNSVASKKLVVVH
jgi:hypothetical protein